LAAGSRAGKRRAAEMALPVPMVFVCGCCSSEKIRSYFHYGYTGVSSPDGGMEFAEEAGVQCLVCGAVDDRPDEIPDPVWLMTAAAADEVDDVPAWVADWVTLSLLSGEGAAGGSRIVEVIAA
jgi:hypothetical protein